MGTESIVLLAVFGTLGVFHLVVLRNAGRQASSKEGVKLPRPVAFLVEACKSRLGALHAQRLESEHAKLRTSLERATRELEVIVKKRQLCSGRLKRLKAVSLRKRKKHLDEITRLSYLRDELATQAQSILVKTAKIQSKYTVINNTLADIEKANSLKNLLGGEPQNIERLMADSSRAILISSKVARRVEAMTELSEELAPFTMSLPFKRNGSTRSAQSAIDIYEAHVIENELKAAESKLRTSNSNSTQAAPKTDEPAFEYILKTNQTFAQLVQKSMRQKGNLAILLNGNIEKNLERLSSLIETAHHTLSTSVEHETEIERELQQIAATYPLYEGDKSDVEKSRESFKTTLRTLRYRNLLLFQRLFEIEIFAERLNHNRLLLELLPTSMQSEISEWTKTAGIIMTALQKLSDDTDVPFKHSEFATRVDKLERTVQMAFIDYIKQGQLELTQSSPKVLQFKQCLEVFEKAQATNQKNYSYWNEQGQKGLENDHEFIVAVSRLRCERYRETQLNAERNADIIKIAMTKFGVA